MAYGQYPDVGSGPIQGGIRRRKPKKIAFPVRHPPRIQGLLDRFGGKPQPAAVDPWAQAQERVRQLNQPYLDEITRMQTEEQNRARQAGQQRQTDLEAYYKGQQPILDTNYNKAITANTQIEKAVQDYYKGAGSAAAGTLLDQLKQINAPGAEQTAANLTGTYAGAGGAEFAIGTSDVQNLVSDKASASEYLQKQKIIDNQQAVKDMNDAITQIAHDYGIKKTDVLANFPEQVASLWQEINAQKSDKTANDFQQQQFAYAKTQDALDRQDARHKLALETKLTMQQTMGAQQYKTWAKKFDAHQKELDRQTRKEIAAYQKTAGQDITGPANRKYITVTDANGNPTLVENPNYVPPKKGGAGATDSVNTPGSAKRDRAYNRALETVFNKDTGAVRDQIFNAKDPDMKALHLINSGLKAAGVDPYSPTGTQIRRSIWDFLDGKTNAKRSMRFTDPRKDNPAFQGKKPKKKK